MVDLHNVGTFNADTGFKADYLNEVEKMFEKVLPHAMLKTKPDLESRIRIVLKKSINSNIVVSLIMTNLLTSTQKIEPLGKILKQLLILLKK
ncbi:hypothetical protein Goklo_029770 [Gossypium klotzschianum]|uniref:Uncharacterized protein n=1 Tax=Gossypium klotzschianum TaxID=34286 RepID=A0A7J8WAC4_9ROSI|nr:hypothetical protein [Gossypium klotzschianum]